MRVLVADDNPLRFECYRVLTALGWDIVCAPTVEEAQRQLVGDRFEMVGLDHDFAVRDCIQDPEGETGRGLAKVVAALPHEKRPDLVIVHTANGSGGDEMEKTLKAAGVRTARVPLPNIFLP